MLSHEGKTIEIQSDAMNLYLSHLPHHLQETIMYQGLLLPPLSVEEVVSQL